MNKNKKILASVLLLAMIIAMIILFSAIPRGVVPNAAEEKMDSNLFYVVSNTYKSDKTKVISFTACFSNLSVDKIIDVSNAENAILFFTNNKPVYINDTYLYVSSAESAVKLAQRMEVVQMNSFGTPEGVKKLDPLLRYELLKLQDSSQLDMELDIIIATKDELNETERETLREKGANIRSVIGKIITCSARAKDIFEIAELEFVERIEISKPLKLLRG
jgi:hypothetical protein